MDRHLTIVTPVFNDWESFCCLARSLDEIAAQLDTLISVLAVDDGSTNLPTMLAPEAFSHLKSVERILLIPATSVGTFIRAIEKIHPGTHERS